MPCLGVANRGKVGRTIKSSESSMNTASELLSQPLEHTVLKKRKSCLANNTFLEKYTPCKCVYYLLCITCHQWKQLSSQPLGARRSKNKDDFHWCFPWLCLKPAMAWGKLSSKPVKQNLDPTHTQNNMCMCKSQTSNSRLANKLKIQPMNFQTNFEHNLKTLARCLPISCFQPGS